jgi:hypothetical protein
MGSAFGSYFAEKARLLLWKTHQEEVTLRYTNAQSQPVTAQIIGIWKRFVPRDGADVDGLGLNTYTGMAAMVVKVEGWPLDAGADAEIDRVGERWAIRHQEPLDGLSIKLHLAKPEAEVRMPGRG